MSLWSASGATCLTFRCSPYHTQQRPVSGDRASPAAGAVAPGGAAGGAARPGWSRPCRSVCLPLQEMVPLLAALRRCRIRSATHPWPGVPKSSKQKTQEALIAWLVAAAEQQPVLAVWEDLHWADPSTLEWLGLFLDQTPTVPLLTLLTCRPEFPPPWASRSSLTQLTLSAPDTPAGRGDGHCG